MTAIAKAKVLHGVLMLLGWGVLLPAGVLIARYLKWKGSLWLKLHIGLQISGLAFGLAGLILALVQFGPFGGSLGGHRLIEPEPDPDPEPEPEPEPEHDPATPLPPLLSR